MSTSDPDTDPDEWHDATETTMTRTRPIHQIRTDPTKELAVYIVTYLQVCGKRKHRIPRRAHSAAAYYFQ